jgi:protein-S-isoprenylcysteine O-methyltransferase Ste14
VSTLKTILFMILVPGTMVVLLPCYLVGSDPALFSFGVFRWLAVPFWAAGAAAMTWCARVFIVDGEGTPLPTNPPKRLITSGLFHLLRNPIYMGAVILLLGFVFWHPASSILWIPVIVAISAHLFVILYEEPHLRKTFGSEYEQYCRSVPRWFPKWRISK